MFAGTIKKRSDGLCSKTSRGVRGPIASETRWTIIWSRAHERFANSVPTISGVVEKTIARRKPSRCKMRSKRSSKLTPHNSIKAPGASAIKIGRIFSIVREINGGATRCQLSAARLQLRHSPREEAWPCACPASYLKNRTSRAARVTGSDAAIFHLVDPIAGFGDDWVMGCQKQSFPALLHDVLQQLKGALGIGSIEVAGRLVRQNDSRIIGQRARDSHTLLFASREMTAGPPQFVT